MEFIADFHVHSKYSRATSRDMDVKHLAEWAKLKGITLMGTGDFTHHLWLEELKHNLEEIGNGLYKYQDIYFVLTAEVSSIYSKKGKGYRIHNLIFSPSFKTTDKINEALGRRGNLASDGRPILGVDAEEIARIVFDIDENCMIVPAHIYTPWFSLFGSMSGFDKIEDCFEKQTPKIFAVESGLSSDPQMSWRLSALDRFSIISNSDSHCVHPDTSIFTANGKPVMIKKLGLPKILNIDFAGNLKQIKSNASKLHKLPSPPTLYKIATRTKEIVTTPEHRFFMLENEEIIEKKASELKKGDLVACLRRISGKGKSAKLPFFSIDHGLKITPKGIDCLREIRLKNKRTQKDIGRYIGVKEDCIWIFEKHKIKTPKESFIDKYCDYLGIHKSWFKGAFLKCTAPLEKFPKFSNENFCKILGYVLGDGGIETSGGKIKNISLTDKDINLLTYYHDLIKEVFNVKGRPRHKKGNSNAVRYPAYLAEYLQRVDAKILAPSPTRQIPEFIFNLPKKEIAAFLGGLFDAEGTIGHHFVQFSSSSPILVKEIQVLLLNFGLHSCIYPDFEKNKKKWRYQLNIYGQGQIKEFAKEIKFKCNKKRKKLLRYLSSLSQSPKNSFVDALPLKEEIQKVKKELAVSCYDIPRRLYYHLSSYNTLKRENVKEFIRIFSDYLTKLPQQKKSILQKLRVFAESDIIWESVQKTEEINSDCEYVYDLTVPYYENYVANGFITHNSPQKIGREANVFNCDLDYKTIREVLKTKDKNRFLYTVEFFPEEGKYHFDGHRLCGIRWSPEETKKHNGRCPKCGKPVTVGVMNRVDHLADRPEGSKPANAIPFKNLISLDEIIADAKGVGKGSKAVEADYRAALAKFGTEFEILLKATKEEISKGLPKRIAEGVLRVREGRVNIKAGFDGEYGTIAIFDEEDRQGKEEQQLSLF